MKQVVIIPARLNSERFPNKILLDLKGLPMIEHVRRRVLLANNTEEVYIATCDEAIKEALEVFGAKVIMTSNQHKNGTTRVAEAVENIDCSEVILVQGDEPLLLPRHLDSMIEAIRKDRDAVAWNATGPIVLLKRHCTKVKYFIALGKVQVSMTFQPNKITLEKS